MNKQIIYSKIIEYKYFISILILFLSMTLHQSTDVKIIRMGNDYDFYFSILIFTILFMFLFKLKKYRGESLILKSLFCGLFVGIHFSCMLNFYNIQISRNNPLKAVDCKVTGTNINRMSRGFYYSFKGKRKFIPGFYSFMNELESNKNNNLYLKLSYSKGWRKNTYIIHSWEVKR